MMNRPNLAEIFMFRTWLCRASIRLGGYPSPRISGFYSLNAGRNFAFPGRFSWAFICLCRHLHCRVIALPEYERAQIQTADNDPLTYLRYGNKPRSEPPLFLPARLRRLPNRIRRA